MATPNFISEDQIEQALVQKLQHLHGFDALDCYTENAKDLNDGSKRASKRDVILVDRVLEAANREIYSLLRDGIPVEFDNAQGVRQHEHVRLLDFNPATQGNNRYLVVTQLRIKGERGFRRPDVLLYVNGIKCLARAFSANYKCMVFRNTLPPGFSLPDQA